MEMTLGQEIRERRTALDLTQQRLAALTGVPPARISEYERGARLPSLATLAALAAVLGPFTIGEGEP